MITRRIFWALMMAAAMAISAAVAPVKSSESNRESKNSELKAGAQRGILNVLDRAEAGQRKALAGSWIVNIDQQGFPPFQRLFTFNSDGGLVVTDDLRVGPMGVEHFTIAQGNWIRTGNRRFAATIVGQRYNLQGSLLGTFKVRMNLELNEILSEWSGRFRIEIILPNGNVIFTSEGTFEATRIEVEPL